MIFASEKMSRPTWAILFLQIVYTCSISVPGNDNLLSTVVLYRHGDRAPMSFYKNDPYAAQVSAIWPDGLGQLTTKGKRQQWALGRWLRARYNGFLSTDYHLEDIEVQSSNVDRCLMSAAANLAGLYPPEGVQVWNPSLPWQPIPIHTRPESDDAKLAGMKSCPKFDELYEELKYNDYYKKVDEDNRELFDYLSFYTGNDVSFFSGLTGLWNTLLIETTNNLTLPEWARGVFPERMNALAYSTWDAFTYTPLMSLLKTGPLIDQITTHFENTAIDGTASPKLLMLSAHDGTIAFLLNSLKLFQPHWPQVAATVVMELRESQGTRYVNILYKNRNDSDEVVELILDGCQFNCELDKFREIVKPIRANLTEWEAACRS